MSRLHSRTVDLAVSGSLLGLLAVVAVWNAFAYPPLGGFDAREHLAYAYDLRDGRLPEGGASYTPPGFYALAALAIRLGEALGMETPEHLAQLLNALCLVGCGVLVLVLGRLLLPGRPLARWSALAFFACSPVVLKTGAMFHPQPLAMLLSLLALTTTAWMVARRDYRLRLWAALALSLAGAQLVRSVSIWVVGVVLVTLVAAAIAQREHRRRIGSALALCALAIVLLPLPWYLHNQSAGGNAVFGRGMSLVVIRQPVAGRVLRRPRPAGRDHASAARGARGRGRPDPLRGDVGRLLRDLVVGSGRPATDARGRPPAGAAEHRRPPADGARAGGLVRPRRPHGLALARGAGAARRRARPARRPRGGRLLRDAELPTRR